MGWKIALDVRTFDVNKVKQDDSSVSVSDSNSVNDSCSLNDSSNMKVNVNKVKNSNQEDMSVQNKSRPK
jgi:hypothetical protein